ncbi:putative quinol monooxygenase [Phenylobacterium sp.]|uniref:putative quinol monooxygenase n=1 Tax=Phenylobacterium sp. TaxID=1871053 RepID=UPI0035B07012
MIIVEGWVRAAPEAIEALKAPAAAMVTATRAEPGCIDYAFAVDLLDPGLLRIIEKWTDDAALAAHFQTPHMAAFNAALAGTARQGAQVDAYSAEFVRTLVKA